MKPGDKIHVRVPAILEYPYNDFSLGWKHWVRDIADTDVVLIDKHAMGYGPSGEKKDGWDVSTEIVGECSHWLPTEWLVTFTGFCDACGGFRSHRLRCPTSRSISS